MRRLPLIERLEVARDKTMLRGRWTAHDVLTERMITEYNNLGDTENARRLAVFIASMRFDSPDKFEDIVRKYRLSADDVRGIALKYLNLYMSAPLNALGKIAGIVVKFGLTEEVIRTFTEYIVNLSRGSLDNLTSHIDKFSQALGLTDSVRIKITLEYATALYKNGNFSMAAYVAKGSGHIDLMKRAALELFNAQCFADGPRRFPSASEVMKEYDLTSDDVRSIVIEKLGSRLAGGGMIPTTIEQLREFAELYGLTAGDMKDVAKAAIVDIIERNPKRADEIVREFSLEDFLRTRITLNESPPIGNMGVLH